MTDPTKPEPSATPAEPAAPPAPAAVPAVEPVHLGTIPTAKRWASLLWSRSKELVSAGVALTGCWAVANYIPRLDPKAGVDVWGAVAAMPAVLLAAMFSWMFAYSMSTTVFRTLRDHEEVKLAEIAAGGRWQPVAIIIVDRVTQLFLWYVVFTRTVGQ